MNFKKKPIIDIQATKLELIKIIADIESERLVEILKAFLQRETKIATNGTAPAPQDDEPEWIRLAREPMPEHLDLDALAKEQGYSTEKLFESLRNFDHELFKDQTLEELLNSLTK